MDLSFVQELQIMTALSVIVAAILLNAVAGVVLSLKKGEFDITLVPQFLARHVFPDVGGLILLLVLLASAGELIGEPFDWLFYLVAGAVLAKYVVKLKDKLSSVFGVVLKK